MSYRKHKIFFIAGTRPHFTKLAPVLQEMKKQPDVEIQLIHTGQHYSDELSKIFFDELNIPAPHVNLEVGSEIPELQFSKILTSLGKVLDEEKPDLVVVTGDTNSTAASALTAALKKIKICHIEAGLREWNKNIPEEVNKLITDSISDLYFCPTQTAYNNLVNANVRGKIVISGDPALDMLYNRNGLYRDEENYLENKGLQKGNYYFTTVHREVNLNDKFRLKNILESFTLLDHPVFFAIHPGTRKAIDHSDLSHYLDHKNIRISAPVGFEETQMLIRNAKKVLTDSGGIIKESYFHGKYVLILDDQTEWVEVVDEGWAVVCGANKDLILENIHNPEPQGGERDSLGEGNASEIIAAEITKFVLVENGI